MRHQFVLLSISLYGLCTWPQFSLSADPRMTYSPRPAEVIISVDADNKVRYQGVPLRLRHEDPPNIVGYCQKIFEFGIVYRVQDAGAPTGQWGPAPGSPAPGHFQLRQPVGRPESGLCTFDASLNFPFPESLKDDQKYIKLCNEGGPVHAPAGYTPPNRRYKDQKIRLFGPQENGMWYTLYGYSYRIVAQLWKRTGARDYQYDNQIHMGAELQCAAIPCEPIKMMPQDTPYTDREHYSQEGAIELPIAYLDRPYNVRLFSGGKGPLDVRLDAADSRNAAAMAQFRLENGMLKGTPNRGPAQGEYLVFSVRVRDSCPYNLDNKEKSSIFFKKQYYKVKLQRYQKPGKLDPKREDSIRPPKDRPGLLKQ